MAIPKKKTHTTGTYLLTFFCDHFYYFLAAFVPGVRYNFHVYASAANRASLLEKKTGYLKELRKLEMHFQFMYLLNSSLAKRGITHPCFCN